MIAFKFKNGKSSLLAVVLAIVAATIIFEVDPKENTTQLTFGPVWTLHWMFLKICPFVCVIPLSDLSKSALLVSIFERQNATAQISFWTMGTGAN